MSEAPPGWYPDPQMPATRRFWNGVGWTDHVAPGEVAKDNTSALAGVGLALAILFPLGGLICGAVLLGRDPKVGALVMVLSATFGALWYIGLSGGV